MHNKMINYKNLQLIVITSYFNNIISLTWNEYSRLHFAQMCSYRPP